jgi:putative transcriptional regulator
MSLTWRLRNDQCLTALGRHSLRREHRKITYDDILNQKGVSKNTLTRLANDRAGMVGIPTVDRLCDYFDCQPGDLFIYVRESQSA